MLPVPTRFFVFAALLLSASAVGCASEDAPFLLDIESVDLGLESVDTAVLQLKPARIGQRFTSNGTGSFYDGRVQTRVAPAGELVITIERAQLSQWVTATEMNAFAASIPLRAGGLANDGEPTVTILLFADANEVARGSRNLPWPLEEGASAALRISAP